VLHGAGKFLFTGVGLGLHIGLTLSMAGIYRGLVDDGQALLAIGGADLWVVQRDTLGPYAEPSSVRDDVYRSLSGIPGVRRRGKRHYLTMQVRRGDDDVRVLLVGFEPGQAGRAGIT
jgi:putative ABC transport system permease protein